MKTDATETQTDMELMEEARHRIGEKELELSQSEETKKQQAHNMPIQKAMEHIATSDICRVLATLLTDQLKCDPQKGYRGIQDAHIQLIKDLEIAQIRLQQEMDKKAGDQLNN